MIYFNNLRAALPTSLTQSFSDFAQTIVTPIPCRAIFRRCCGRGVRRR